MKFLIWTLSILITSIVAVIIKSAGITLGAIPTMILYAPLFFITPKLCKKWDEHKSNKEKNDGYSSSVFHNGHTTKNSTPENHLQAITITNIDDLPNYYGKFVKLQIKGLENCDTFKLRIPRLAGALSEEAKRDILAKPLSKLLYQCEIDIRINVEPITLITASSYEDTHTIYGILRRKGNGNVEYTLTNAFIASPGNYSQRIAQALKSQSEFEYSVLEDGTISIINFMSESVEELVIPEEIGGRPVTAISHGAFDGNQTIRTLKIPNSVKNIEYSFSQCNNLESVDLGDGVESVYAFDVCQKLRKVYIGKSVVDIKYSFHNCHALTSLEISPDNAHLCVIDGVLFSKDRTTLVLCPCGKKGKYIVPSGTKVIGCSAFENTDLEEIVIANTVEILDVCAFDWAANVKRLTIPSSVVEINYDAVSKAIKEIIVERGSYAHQYFEDFDDGEYNITVVNKLLGTPSTVLGDSYETFKIFCHHCGTQLPLDSDSCFKCGAKLEEKSYNHTSSPYDRA